MYVHVYIYTFMGNEITILTTTSLSVFMCVCVCGGGGGGGGVERGTNKHQELVYTGETTYISNGISITYCKPMCRCLLIL